MILETLLGLTDNQLLRLGLDRQTMGNSDEMMKAINKIIGVEDFAKKLPQKRSITGGIVSIWGLVCTGVDNSTIWFNNGVTILNTSDVSDIIYRYIEYSSPERYNTFVMGDVVIPMEDNGILQGMDVGNYRVYQLGGENGRGMLDYTQGILFGEKMVVEDAVGARYLVPNNDRIFKKSDFNRANIAVERVKVKVRPVVELMMKRNKEDAYKNYDEAMRSIIRATRELEASNNSANIDVYVTKIIDNISTSLVGLKDSPAIKDIHDNGNFLYTVKTDILRCDGHDIGPYKLEINMIDGRVSIKNMWLEGSGRYNHPHIQSGGSVCWGTMATTVSEALKFWNLSLTVDACISLVTSLNPNSTYVGMEEFMRTIENSTGYKKYMSEEVIGKRMEEWKAKALLIETRLAEGAREVFYGHQVYSITI